jgi:orotate phosphoribosyltransferase
MPVRVFGTAGDVGLFYAANAVGIKRPKVIVFKQGDWSPGAYLNNRALPSHPTQWNTIMRLMLKEARALRNDYDGIASVATGGIAHGISLAKDLCLPHFIVKKQEKEEHGLAGLIDGDESLLPGKRLLLVEDMSTTFLSSIKAIRPLEHEGATVAHTLLLNTWGWPEFYTNVSEHSVHALCTGEMILNYAVEHGKIDREHEGIMRNWLKDPKDRSWAKDGTWVLPKQASD